LNKIREVLVEKGLTVAGTARAARISRSHFYDIMNESKNPSMKLAKRIARAIDSNLDELFPV